MPPLHRKCVASASVLPKHVQYDSPIGSYGGRHANTDGVTEAILNESCLSNLNQNTFCCLQAIVTLSFGQRGVDTGLICHEVLICYNLPGRNSSCCICWTMRVASGRLRSPLTFLMPVPKHTPHTRTARPKQLGHSTNS